MTPRRGAGAAILLSRALLTQVPDHRAGGGRDRHGEEGARDARERAARGHGDEHRDRVSFSRGPTTTG